MTDNPFEILRLAPDTSDEEAVRLAARLCARALDEPTRNRVRQAIQQLTASAEDRELLALLTHPRPQHSSADLDRLIATYRRPPAVAGDANVVPPLNLDEVRAILLAELARQQVVTPAALEPVVVAESADEIARQTSEALWQGLLTTPEAI